MRFMLLILMWAGCAKEPAWVESCACGDGQICRADFFENDPEGEGCIDVPEACAAAYADDGCDLSAIDDACLEAACGAVVPSYEGQCWEEDARMHFWLDCEISL